MTFPQEDQILLGNMLEASEWVLAVIEGRTRPELEEDLLLFLALVKAVEIVGEAANKISDSTQHASPEIPWRRIIGMRNRLVHNYNDIDLSTLWLVAQEHTPTLITQIRRLLPDGYAPIPLR